MRLRIFSTTARLLAVARCSRTVIARAAEPTQQQIEAIIARVTAELFQRSHYSHHPLGCRDVREVFRPLHRHARSGAPELSCNPIFRSSTNTARTLGPLTKKGDTTPAHVIFDRFLQRAEQRNELSTNLLANGNFDFTGNDRFLANRKNAPQPKDMDEAKQAVDRRSALRISPGKTFRARHQAVR